MPCVPTDAQILQAMQARPHGIMTYVIRNFLAMEHGFRDLATSTVLARLKRLERQGKVQRVPSGYAVMLCWACVAVAPSVPEQRTRDVAIGDIVTRTGHDRYRVTALYDGCDEIVITNCDDPADVFDILEQDVRLVERAA